MMSEERPPVGVLVFGLVGIALIGVVGALMIFR